MNEFGDAVTILDEHECWEHLTSHQLGRLVTHVGDVLDIFPVNYVLDGRSLVFRTAEGSKLLELTTTCSSKSTTGPTTVRGAWSCAVTPVGWMRSTRSRRRIGSRSSRGYRR